MENCPVNPGTLSSAGKVLVASLREHEGAVGEQLRRRQVHAD